MPKQIYHCKKCKYTTDRKYNWEIHKKSNKHTGYRKPKKLYSCTKCDYETYDNSNWYKHTRTKKHQDNLVCDICGVGTFAGEYAYNTHKKCHLKRDWVATTCFFLERKAKEIEKKNKFHVIDCAILRTRREITKQYYFENRNDNGFNIRNRQKYSYCELADILDNLKKLIEQNQNAQNRSAKDEIELFKLLEKQKDMERIQPY